MTKRSGQSNARFSREPQTMYAGITAPMKLNLSVLDPLREDLDTG